MVRRQIEVGVDIVDDGELSKTSWNDYVVHRLSGLERKPRSRARSAEPWSVARGIVRPRETGSGEESISKALRDTTEPTSPSFMIWHVARATAHDNGGTAYVCTAPLGWRDFAAVETDIARLAAAR